MTDRTPLRVTNLGLPAIARLACILPLLGMLWVGVRWAMG